MPAHRINEHECYASLGNSGSSYIALRTDVVPYEELEAMANARSGGSDLSWDDYTPIEDSDFDLEENDLREDWKGKSTDQKRESLWVWFDSFYRMPSPDDFIAKYKVEIRTYYNRYGVRETWKARFGSYDAVNPNALSND